MKAAAKQSNGFVTYVTVDDPMPEAGRAIIEVHWGGDHTRIAAAAIAGDGDRCAEWAGRHLARSAPRSLAQLNECYGPSDVRDPT